MPQGKFSIVDTHVEFNERGAAMSAVHFTKTEGGDLSIAISKVFPDGPTAVLIDAQQVQGLIANLLQGFVIPQPKIDPATADESDGA